MPSSGSTQVQSLLARLNKKALFVAGAGLVAVMMLYGACVDYVRPYESGIKEARYSGGIKPDIIGGGRWVFTGPGVTIHRFPTALQALEMSQDLRTTSEGSADVRHVPRIQVSTTDGSNVKVDVTVLYRIVDPYKVMTQLGPRRLFEDAAVIPKAELALKNNLGKLNAEDFYHELKRVEHTLAARDEMNELLKDVGIAVDHVLIRQYYYEEGYAKQIESRKVQDQLVFTNRSAAEAAKEDAARRKVESQGEANANVERKRGEAEVIKIRAEADLYKRKKESEGDMLVQVGEAKGTQLVNTAYASSGSDNLVALEMAKVLDGISLIVVSDPKNGLNPLDVDQMMKLVGAK